jgi:hypothetical protein
MPYLELVGADVSEKRFATIFSVIQSVSIPLTLSSLADFF